MYQNLFPFLTSRKGHLCIKWMQEIQKKKKKKIGGQADGRQFWASNIVTLFLYSFQAQTIRESRETRWTFGGAWYVQSYIPRRTSQWWEVILGHPPPAPSCWISQQVTLQLAVLSWRDPSSGEEMWAWSPSSKEPGHRQGLSRRVSVRHTTKKP